MVLIRCGFSKVHKGYYLLLNHNHNPYYFPETLRLLICPLYTTIPHAQLKDQLHHLIKRGCFYKKGNRRYKCLVLGYNNSYFVKNYTDSTRKYTEDDNIKMLNFLIDNILVEFRGLMFQQTVGIPMGTNCVSLLAEFLLYSYVEGFIQKLLKDYYMYVIYLCISLSLCSCVFICALFFSCNVIM